MVTLHKYQRYSEASRGQTFKAHVGADILVSMTVCPRVPNIYAIQQKKNVGAECRHDMRPSVRLIFLRFLT